MKKSPKIKLGFDVAIKQLLKFMDSEVIKSKEQFLLHLRTAVRKATINLANYKEDRKINMEKEELLRDVIFIGSALLETTSQNHYYFNSLIASCFDIVEKGANITFNDSFIKKIATSKNEFVDVDGAKTVLLYYMFKSHFRYKPNS